MNFIENVALHHGCTKQNDLWAITPEQMVKITSNLAKEFANSFDAASTMLVQEYLIAARIQEHIQKLETL